MRRSTLYRIVTYTTVKALWLAAMLAIGIFLSIVVINYGGYIDKIFEGQINDAIGGYALAGYFRDMTPEEQNQAVEEIRWNLEERYGLHEPFLLRCARWFRNALTFDFGVRGGTIVLGGSSVARHDVRALILQRFPNTLLLSGSVNLLLFVISVFVALPLARKYGSLLDKAIVALSPLSAAPNWVYGVILVVVFAAQLHWLPYNGMFDEFPPTTIPGYIAVVLKHMVLPGVAITLSVFFQSVYAWRTFYLMHIEDDPVEMARARGLPPRLVERRYVLRPALPFLLTSFAVLLMTFWQTAIALETLFDWPGIGQLLLVAIRTNDRGVTVGVVVIFAYLLGLTIFLLDIVYALVDPRIRLGSEKPGDRMAEAGRRRRRRPWQRRAAEGPLFAPHVRWHPEDHAPARPPALAWRTLRRRAGASAAAIRELARYPSALVGLAMIIVMCAVAVYTPIAIPYSRAVALWQGQGNPWEYNPKNAQPSWTNLFRRADLPETLILNSRDHTAGKQVFTRSKDMREIAIDFEFDYPYAGLPQDIVLNMAAKYIAKHPHVVLTWLAPDGRELELGNFSTTSEHRFYIGQDKKLERRLGEKPLPALFADPAGDSTAVLPGRYTLHLSAFVFEDEADFDAEMVLYGQVHGWAGTDHRRRDLGVPMLWGMPVALAFGLAGAVATSLATMLLAAIGVWFGGAVDNVIQRVTEVSMIIPALPIAIMVYFLYSKTVWAILGVMVLLNIFGSALKNYRSAFLQIKSSPYIEAAQTYGAGNGRIIFRYMVPRILPVLLPQIVIMVPGFVFLEATLAYLGVQDFYLPTWGKVIFDALTNGAYRGYYYWVLEPIALLLLAGLAFALVGLALERIYNPRLRSR